MGSIVAFDDVWFDIAGKEILRGVTFEVEAGETLVLLGRSGSGKTTALKMVNGLLFPGGGDVAVEGVSTRAWDPIRLKRRIGYVIQDIGLFPHFTVEANVGLVPKLEGWSAARVRARVEELLDVVGLPAGEFAARYPRELSGGQKQRVGVARALAADPPLLLFDEPFGAVDPLTRIELQREFLRIQQAVGKTAIFVTHDVREALLLGTRIGLMRDGKLAALATRAEFPRVDDPDVRAFLSSLDWLTERA